MSDRFEAFLIAAAVVLIVGFLILMFFTSKSERECLANPWPVVAKDEGFIPITTHIWIDGIMYPQNQMVDTYTLTLRAPSGETCSASVDRDVYDAAQIGKPLPAEGK